ncbi:MAG: hypothetical protein K0S81_4107 [Rhodospirillales bacterium]|jgi:hypothetical protein|nr:hypothetical protein [Rhodospirillales bacterium]
MTAEGAARGSRREQAQRAVLALAAVAMGFNGLRMLIDATGWYAATPGVAETGPLNIHFVRDVGAAFVTVAAGLVFAIRPLPARFALVCVAAIFAALHALIHIAEAFGPEGRPFVGAEAAAILVPAIAAVATAVWTWPRGQGGA